MTVKKIIDDDRVIERISIPSQQRSHNLGFDAEKIIPYLENGEMAHVTWFAVYVDGVIRHRYPSHMTAVTYKTLPKRGQKIAPNET